MAGVRGKRFRYNQKSISECVDTELDLSFHLFLKVFTSQARRASYLERPSSGDNAFVDDHVVHTAETIPNGVFNLGYSVRVWAFDE